MLFKVIYHQGKPCKTSETFDCGIWAAILISETSSVVSSVTASCNIKQVSYRSFSLHCHATKNEIGNRAVEEAKKIKCYKRLIYKQFVQVSDLLWPTVSELFAETFHTPL